MKVFATGVFLICLTCLISCTSKTGNSLSDSPKFQQYYVQGEVLYKQYCSNCHQFTGKGLGRLYPPLNESDFLENNFEEVICIIKFGKQGLTMVNGVDYNIPMKGNPGLTELEVAEIATYIYNTWSNHRGLIDVKDVSPILSSCNN